MYEVRSCDAIESPLLRPRLTDMSAFDDRGCDCGCDEPALYSNGDMMQFAILRLDLALFDTEE